MTEAASTSSKTKQNFNTEINKAAFLNICMYQIKSKNFKIKRKKF